MKSITRSELKLLAESGAISRIKIEPVNNDKWVAVVRTGLTERLLYTARGQVREFSDLDRLISVLKGLGVPNAEIKIC